MHPYAHFTFFYNFIIIDKFSRISLNWISRIQFIRCWFCRFKYMTSKALSNSRSLPDLRKCSAARFFQEWCLSFGAQRRLPTHILVWVRHYIWLWIEFHSIFRYHNGSICANDTTIPIIPFMFVIILHCFGPVLIFLNIKKKTNDFSL